LNTHSIPLLVGEIATSHITARPWSRGVGPVVGCLPCYQTACTGVILMQITYTDNGAADAHGRCQSKSQGTRYRLGLIVYDIVAVKIFDRHRNIALSIRALMASHSVQWLLRGVRVWQMTYVQMDRPCYGNICRSSWNYFQRCCIKI